MTGEGLYAREHLRMKSGSRAGPLFRGRPMGRDRSFRVSAPRPLTSGPKEHLFASYYGIEAWSADRRYALVLETDLRTRLPTENDPATLGVVDIGKGNRFVPLTETRCWNFQEGTMAHWLGPRTFVYNDAVGGRFAGVIMDVDARTKRVIPWPISALAPDRRWALSINYARLRRVRPSYGYGGDGQDPQTGVMWPDNDGLWRVDLRTGEAHLIVPIAAMRDRMENPGSPDALAYFCHTTFSRDGRRIFWLARTEGGSESSRKTTAFVCDRNGQNRVRCFPEGWGGSHFNWLDGKRLVVTARYRNAVFTHVLFTAGKDDYVRLGGGLLDFDGHAVFSPDGRWMITDTYPDALRERRLILWDMTRQSAEVLGAFQVPEDFAFGSPAWPDCRCDLHARWRGDGRQIGFNSVHEGTRQAYVMDVKG